MRSSQLSCCFATTLLAALLATGSASAEPMAEGPEPLRPSIALERVGGVSYSRASADDSDAHASVTAFALGGVAINPYSTPRLGFDVPILQGLTVGASGSIARMSLSASDGDTSRDLGSLTIYSLTPRVGYTLRPHSRFDLSLRAGVMLAGGSVDSDDGDSSYGVFTTSLDLEALGAIRVTPSLNVLVGFAFDRTLSGSVSVEGSSGDDGGGTVSEKQTLDGGLTTAQLWLGLGGYL